MDDKDLQGAKDMAKYIKRQAKEGREQAKVNRRGRLSQHIEIKRDNWSVGSKKKLKASMRHKMRRIFVGVLDALDRERSEGLIDTETAARLRSKILNIANDQIRNMEMEIEERYNVEAVNYHVDFKVIKKDGNNEGS